MTIKGVKDLKGLTRLSPPSAGAAPLPLAGRVAVVTGATRGVGKGVALGLAEAGATVVVTGRTEHARGGRLRGSLDETAEAVREAGGIPVPIRCDHSDDDQVRALFERVGAELGRLDVLVNNAFKVPRVSFASKRFWELPLSIWDDMHRVGLRSHYAASALAAPLLIRTASQAKQDVEPDAPGEGGLEGQPPGPPPLIANISSYGGGQYVFGVAYGVGKAGVDRMAADMAHDLGPFGVAAVSLWPGIVRTERMLRLRGMGAMDFDDTNSESPRFTGRAVAALAADPGLMERSGQRLIVAELARAYGFTDVGGGLPEVLAPDSPSLVAARHKSDGR